MNFKKRVLSHILQNLVRVKPCCKSTEIFQLRPSTGTDSLTLRKGKTFDKETDLEHIPVFLTYTYRNTKAHFTKFF